MIKKGWMIMRIRQDGDTQPYNHDPYLNKKDAKEAMKSFARSKENKKDTVRFFLVKVYY